MEGEKPEHVLKKKLSSSTLYRFQDSENPESRREPARTLTTAHREEDEKEVLKDQLQEKVKKDRRIVTKSQERKIKRTRAQGGCQGTKRRRRTWQAAKSKGEPQAGIDPLISEWGNPAG